MNRSEGRTGFTITELLVVIAILSIVASIVLPTAVSSRFQAYVADNQMRLHQCQIAVSLYQLDNDGISDRPHSLPDPFDYLSTIKVSGSFYGSTIDQWTSACGWHPKGLTSRFVLFSTRELQGVTSYDRLGEQTILIADANCNPSNVDLQAAFVTKRGMGVLINGTLVQRRHTGDVYTYQYWETGP